MAQWKLKSQDSLIEMEDQRKFVGRGKSKMKGRSTEKGGCSRSEERLCQKEESRSVEKEGRRGFERDLSLGFAVERFGRKCWGGIEKWKKLV